jgi:hypothetical protein
MAHMYNCTAAIFFVIMSPMDDVLLLPTCSRILSPLGFPFPFLLLPLSIARCLPLPPPPHIQTLVIFFSSVNNFKNI